MFFIFMKNINTKCIRMNLMTPQTWMPRSQKSEIENSEWDLPRQRRQRTSVGQISGSKLLNFRERNIKTLYFERFTKKSFIYSKISFENCLPFIFRKCICGFPQDSLRQKKIWLRNLFCSTPTSDNAVTLKSKIP